MGTWNVGITSNDTAQDLLSEYQAAFSYYDVDTALLKIDNYVRMQGINEDDKEEWCDYYYSLALFMWKKGILTDQVRNQAIKMIDENFGLEIWEESGKNVLGKRTKVLAELKEKLMSPQPDKKKIKINLHLNPIFEVGDIIAFKLITDDKVYLAKDSYFDDQFFAQANGKYVVVRKIADHISYRSNIAPDIKDHWAVFQLYSKIFDSVPEMSDLKKISWANTGEPFGVFVCESSLSYFRKRKYQMLGNDSKGIAFANIKKRWNTHIFFSINKPHYNADTLIINAIIKK
jgi:hypothetical protein